MPLEKCGVCRAPLKNRQICRRCGADYTRLFAMKNEEAAHCQKAREAYGSRDIPKMLHHARLSYSKHHSVENRCLLACAAVLANDFELALNLWLQKKM